MEVKGTEWDWTDQNYISLKENGAKKSYPELDEEERVVWPFFKKLLQASFLLWELVVDLPNIH